MSCGIEFQILTPWYKEDCCSFVLFMNGIVNMKSGTAGRVGMSDFGLCEVLV